MRLIDVGTEVTVAGLTVHPGDLLHSDEHGVPQIPAEALRGIARKRRVDPRGRPEHRPMVAVG
jgi:4-hydroxy-4-methyl-2-oxoglutarate aldolase